MHVSTATEKLGEILVREDWITAQQRDWATAVQDMTGCRLGAILVAAGLIRRDAVYRVLARTWECDYVDLVSTPLDLSLLDGLDPLDLREEGWLPYRRDGERVVVATSERPTPQRQRSIENRLGSPVELVVSTDWDILRRCTPPTARRSSIRRPWACGGATTCGRRGRRCSPASGCCSASCSPGSPPESCWPRGRCSPW